MLFVLNAKAFTTWENAFYCFNLYALDENRNEKHLFHNEKMSFALVTKWTTLCYSIFHKQNWHFSIPLFHGIVQVFFLQKKTLLNFQKKKSWGKTAHVLCSAIFHLFLLFLSVLYTRKVGKTLKQIFLYFSASFDIQRITRNCAFISVLPDIKTYH